MGNSSVSDSYIDSVALGLIKGVISKKYFGETFVFSGGVTSDITAIGNDIAPTNDGELLQIYSNSINDTQTIELFLLGIQGMLLPPINVQLNGINPVTIPGGLYSRINGMRCISSTGVESSIEIGQNGGGNLYAQMLPESQILTSARFTVPSNHVAIITNISASIQNALDAADVATIKVKYRPFGQLQWFVMAAFGIGGSGTSATSFPNLSPTALRGPMDIKLTVLSQASGMVADGDISIRLYSEQ